MLHSYAFFRSTKIRYYELQILHRIQKYNLQHNENETSFENLRKFFE